MTEDKKPWWWPVVTDEKYIARLREDYPEETTRMSDEEVRDYYDNGRKYSNLWDHVGDAADEHEKLADAFLKLVEETGKKPGDFL